MSFGNDAKLSDKEQATADAIGSLLRRSIPSSSSSPTSNLHEGCIEPLSYSKEAWVGNNSLHCYQEYGSSSASKGDVHLKKKHSNYHDLVSLVASQLDMVQKYLGEVESGVDTMHQHYQRVVTSGKEVSNECQQLLNCQQELLLSAERFDSMIKYFDQAEVVASQLQGILISQQRVSNSFAASQDVSRGAQERSPYYPATQLSQQFCQILENLERSFAFLSLVTDRATSSEGSTDIKRYRATFLQLRTRLLRAIRTHVQLAIDQAVGQSQAKSSVSSLSVDSALGTSSHPEEAEGSVPWFSSLSQTFMELRALALVMKPLLGKVAAKATGGTVDAAAYRELLLECQRRYTQSRHAVIHHDVSSHLALLMNKATQKPANKPASTLNTPLPEAGEQAHLSQAVRESATFLVEVCSLEFQLFYDYFGKTQQAAEQLSALLQALCGSLYTQLRPIVLHEDSLSVLVELVGILRHEVLEAQLVPRGECVADMRAVVLRLLQDVQERIVFRAEAFVQQRIARCAQVPADVDYPNKLLQLQQKQSARPAAVANVLPAPEAYLHPTLRSTLTVLSGLYQCVEPPVFQSLAHMALDACTAALVKASKDIAGAKAPTGTGAGHHSILFMVMHLMVMRRELAPYRVDLTVTEKTLDLSRMTGLLPALLGAVSPAAPAQSQEAVRVGAGHHQNSRGGGWVQGFAQVFSRAGPRLEEHQLDSRKDLELLLKQYVQALVKAQTEQVVGPLALVLEGKKPKDGVDDVMKERLRQILKDMTAIEKAEGQPGGKQEQEASGSSKFSSSLHQIQLLNHAYLMNKSTEKVVLKPLLASAQNLLAMAEAIFQQGNPEQHMLGVISKLQQEAAAVQVTFVSSTASDADGQ